MLTRNYIALTPKLRRFFGLLGDDFVLTRNLSVLPVLTHKLSRYFVLTRNYLVLLVLTPNYLALTHN